MKKNNEYIQMRVTGINVDPFTHLPFMILKDLKGKLPVPIWIGLIEASSIATKLENVKLERPMTHDLLMNMLDKLKATITKVQVDDLKDNTFFASIYYKKNSAIYVVDSRPSDAVALAIRTNAPIFVAKKVVEQARKIDLTKKPKKSGKAKGDWREILEGLESQDFGKYKM